MVKVMTEVLCGAARGAHTTSYPSAPSRYPKLINDSPYLKPVIAKKTTLLYPALNLQVRLVTDRCPAPPLSAPLLFGPPVEFRYPQLPSMGFGDHRGECIHHF